MTKEKTYSPASAPVCPIFGRCGGCQYQDISYCAELAIKEKFLRELFAEQLGCPPELFDPIEPSPTQYQYRSSLDLKLLRTRSGEVFIGFSPEGINCVVPASRCLIARDSLSDFMPELKIQATAKLTPRYRNANLVVKTGDDNRVLWGGIGKRSLQLPEKDYLWTEVNGKRIFYSLATFFQSNLSILPAVIRRILELNVLDRQTVFYDLYGGVGFFGLAFSAYVRRVVLIEENLYATKVAHFNRAYHGLTDFEIFEGKVEDRFLATPLEEKSVIMVDPPRAGLSPSVVKVLCANHKPQALFYLSCNPQSLVRDLGQLTQNGWQMEKIIPLDFFPRTKHIETFVWLRPLPVTS